VRSCAAAQNTATTDSALTVLYIDSIYIMKQVNVNDVNHYKSFFKICHLFMAHSKEEKEQEPAGF
jgi:hypothetical protein